MASSEESLGVPSALHEVKEFGWGVADVPDERFVFVDEVMKEKEMAAAAAALGFGTLALLAAQ